jgi:hypothetical protein
MIKIYDADDEVLSNMPEWVDFVELVSIEELPNSPHVFRVYQWKDRRFDRNNLRLIIRDKHLARREFNSLDTARDLLSKFTLKGQNTTG